jgi:L-asparagine transporter-like permease
MGSDKLQHTKSRGVVPINHIGNTVKQSAKNGSLNVPQLILIGVGGIIGAGFFLGVGLPIRTAGPAVLFAFLIGAFVTAHVVGALTSLAVYQPVKGSFMVYTQEYIGNFAGFIEGWGYYISSILVIVSEAVAMSIFTKMWIPMIPSWITTSVFALIILLINAFGTKNFSYVESLMSVVKIAALVGLIVVLGLEWVHPYANQGQALTSGQFHSRFFANGVSGLFQSMLIVIFAYAGIGVFGTAAVEMRNPKHIERAAWVTISALTILYIVSIAILLVVVPLHDISTNISPFVIALQHTGIPIIAQIFNGIILIASFSVMAGSVFSANQILYGLGQMHESPSFVTRTGKNNVLYGALAITATSIAITILISYLLPANVYNFLISSSSFFTLLTWFLILWAFLSWHKITRGKALFVSSLAMGKPVMTVVVMIIIVLLAGYALLQRDQLYGFYAFVVILLAISASYLFFIKKSKKNNTTI